MLGLYKSGSVLIQHSTGFVNVCINEIFLKAKTLYKVELENVIVVFLLDLKEQPIAGVVMSLYIHVHLIEKCMVY